MNEARGGGDALFIAWTLGSGLIACGALCAATRLRLSQEDEFAAADLSIPEIGAARDREVSR